MIYSWRYFLKIILYFWILMLSYKIINLYIEWYLHYTLDYYINYEYNIYIQILFSFSSPKDKFQVTSLLQFYSHNLSFLMTTLKIFLELSLAIWMLIWIFFLLILRPPELEILVPSLILALLHLSLRFNDFDRAYMHLRKHYLYKRLFVHMCT